MGGSPVKLFFCLTSILRSHRWTARILVSSALTTSVALQRNSLSAWSSTFCISQLTFSPKSEAVYGSPALFLWCKVTKSSVVCFFFWQSTGSCFGRGLPVSRLKSTLKTYGPFDLFANAEVRNLHSKDSELGFNRRPIHAGDSMYRFRSQRALCPSMSALSCFVSDSSSLFKYTSLDKVKSAVAGLDDSPDFSGVWPVRKRQFGVLFSGDNGGHRASVEHERWCYL